MSQREGGYKGRSKFVKLQEAFKARLKKALKGKTIVSMGYGRSTYKGKKRITSSQRKARQHAKAARKTRRRDTLKRQQRQALNRRKSCPRKTKANWKPSRKRRAQNQ
jgi:hypothetical protein